MARTEARDDRRAGRSGARDVRYRVAVIFVAWLAVIGCQATTPAATTSPTPSPPGAFPLTGTAWLAEEIDGQRVVDGTTATTVTFDGRTQAVGSTGCNRYAAPFQVAGATVRLGEIAMTRRACPSAIMDQESRFVAALAATRAYRQEGATLWLLDESGRVLARFTRPQRERIRPGEPRQEAPVGSKK